MAHSSILFPVNLRGGNGLVHTGDRGHYRGGAYGQEHGVVSFRPKEPDRGPGIQVDLYSGLFHLADQVFFKVSQRMFEGDIIGELQLPAQIIVPQ